MSSSTSLSFDKFPTKTKSARRARRNTISRVEDLAKPSERRMEELFKAKAEILPRKCSEKIKESLEEKYFQDPWSTENYFRERELRNYGSKKSSESLLPWRKEWLAKFSAEIARMMSSWMMQRFECGISPGDSYMDLTELSDIILEKVANILHETKPSRKDPERLSRFMIAVSDRLAVWMDDKIKTVHE